ncbi:hypothetical protein ACVMB1_000199 [Bradyrhizobium sp. USDA 4504]
MRRRRGDTDGDDRSTSTVHDTRAEWANSRGRSWRAQRGARQQSGVSDKMRTRASASTWLPATNATLHSLGGQDQIGHLLDDYFQCPIGLRPSSVVVGARRSCGLSTLGPTLCGTGEGGVLAAASICISPSHDATNAPMPHLNVVLFALPGFPPERSSRAWHQAAEKRVVRGHLYGTRVCGCASKCEKYSTSEQACCRMLTCVRPRDATSTRRRPLWNAWIGSNSARRARWHSSTCRFFQSRILADCP